ncbi:beta-1,4-N-acetylglucosaminyltransferase family protein [Artemisia annua]|uniref:Beta-1,4-N-acetylglucosaminyltransferase family protein n=1 Tax=Artemisia annua TaxID=35608 RepID=A0A2U1NH94_ARTAN|nr:beta-1,4-N-acetylglucosaminyltransferase family protein [Artemisia annua]
MGFIIMNLNKLMDRIYLMAEEGGSRYCSKKSDDICGDICDDQDSGKVSAITRVKCILRGLDLKTLIFIFVLVPTVIFGLYMHGQKISYFLRPLWEKPPKPFNEIPHYYHENVSMQNLCSLHGWKTREFPRRVFDAVLFSNEVDLLKIRWHELYPYVTEFILLESNSTFTGVPKPLVFSGHRDEFKFVDSRLTYGVIPGRFKKGENPFVEEAYQRLALDYLIRKAGIEDDDLLIMSDVDEIPSRHTINLLRWCDDIPEVLHLRLKNYLYSFEFLLDNHSWRASVHRYRSGTTTYAHFRQSDVILADAGWHCSFCFRRINEFIFKMKAYSHNDRVRFKKFLNPERSSKSDMQRVGSF